MKWLKIVLKNIMWLPVLVCADGITWNLQDVAIRTFIEKVAEDQSLNVHIDPQVQGKITLYTNQPLKQDEAFDSFVSVLDSQGYAVVKKENMMHIVPAKQGRTMSQFVSKDQKQGWITTVYKLKYILAREAVLAIKPLFSINGHVKEITKSNQIVMADSSHNIQQVYKLLAEIDLPFDDEVEMIPLQHASAYELAQMIKSLVEQEGQRGQQKLFIAADERSNSLLISGDKSRRVSMRVLARKLDRPARGNHNTQVIYLKYVGARDIAPIIANIISSSPEVELLKKQTPQTESNYLRKATPVVNRFGQSTSVPSIQSSSRALKEPDYAYFDDNDPEKTGTVSQFVQWDDTTNSLIVKAPPDLMRSIRNIIAKLDIRRPQVLIEVIIAEVSDEHVKELGIQWNSGQGAVRGMSRANLGNGTTSIGGTLAGVVPPNTPLGAAGLSVGYFHQGNLRTLLTALDSDNHTNILSTPNIVTLDNETATIKVGQLVPFAIGTNTDNLAAGGTPFTSFQREEVGLSLTIKPHITHSGAVHLKLEHILSNVIPGSAGAGPGGNSTTSERVIQTNVMVDDQEVLVLGGLIQNDWVDKESKVPLLGSLPIIGHAFTQRSRQLTKKNLMLFLKPIILRDKEDSVVISGDKYDFLRKKQMQTPRSKIYGADLEPPFLPEQRSFRKETIVLPPPFQTWKQMSQRTK